MTTLKSSPTVLGSSSPAVVSTTVDAPEISVVIPCLNEARSIGICVQKALAAFREIGIQGEVVVADNGSTDGSIAIAESLGARVVHVSTRGYGNALQALINDTHNASSDGNQLTNDAFTFNADASGYLADNSPYLAPGWETGYNTVTTDIDAMATDCGMRTVKP